MLQPNYILKKTNPQLIVIFTVCFINIRFNFFPKQNIYLSLAGLLTCSRICGSSLFDLEKVTHVEQNLLPKLTAGDSVMDSHHIPFSIGVFDDTQNPITKELAKILHFIR